ncbi:MAG: DUF5665 domain-containing protein [Candidatus Microsaccharimonas sp.]
MIQKAARKLKEDNERGARQAILEDLFYDFHKSRRQVYLMNFVRGLFFGVGSVIGGTLVVAFVLSLLGLLVDIPGGVGDFIQYIVDLVKQNKTP